LLDRLSTKWENRHAISRELCDGPRRGIDRLATDVDDPVIDDDGPVSVPAEYIDLTDDPVRANDSPGAKVPVMARELHGVVIRQIGDGRDLRRQPEPMASEEPERWPSGSLDHESGKLCQQILTVAHAQTDDPGPSARKLDGEITAPKLHHASSLSTTARSRQDVRDLLIY
jgi:hypothetical protein